MFNNNITFNNYSELNVYNKNKIFYQTERDRANNSNNVYKMQIYLFF